MIDKNRLMLIALVAGNAIGVTGLVAADLPESTRDTITRTSVAKQEVLSQSLNIKAKADRLMIAANNSFVDGSYEEAIKLYIEAKKVFSTHTGSAFAKERKSCDSQIEKCYFYWAQNLTIKANKEATSKNYEEAINLCREATKLYPENSKLYEKKISEFEREKSAAEMREATNTEALVPQKSKQEYRISVLMAQAQKYMENKMYDKAVRKYNDILLIDPYNENAIFNLKAARVRSADIAEERFDLAHRKMITELEWRWVTPILPDGESPMDNVIESSIDKDDARNTLEEKIRNLMIPDANFEDISVGTAIKKLQELSKANDPEGKGVNIFYRRNVDISKLSGDDNAKDAKATTKPEAAPKEEDSDLEEFADDVSEFADDVKTTVAAALPEEEVGPKVSVIFSNRTFYDALSLLCKTADLQMRVERNAVVLAAKDVSLDELETKIFPVEKSVFDGVDLNDATALKTYFEDLLVPFPEGASAVYDTKISRLIATNTLSNLLRLEEVLQELQRNKPAMVEIVAKFIEINQDDLKELGFDYSISYNPANAPYSSDSSIISDSASQKLSFSESLSGMTRNNAENALFVVSGVAGGENGFAYTAQVFAQDRASSTDTLASPRITTLENTSAHIEMVTEQYFVDEYDEGTLQQGSSSDDSSGIETYYYISPMPQFDSVTKLGIQLDILPRIVDKDRRKIEVTMNPSVTTFAGYTEYEYTDSSGSTEYMKKPEINVREINTKVIIADGETIVLGGVINDSVSTINDKIPILGDLPLIGRLFQSRSTSSEKRNLLIFMTCRLVKPDGTPLYPTSSSGKRGAPELGRLE